MLTFSSGANLRMRTDVPADLRELEATFSYEAGAPVAFLPFECMVYRHGPNDALLEASRVVLPRTAAEANPYANPQFIAPPERILDFARNGNTGVVRSNSGCFVPVKLPTSEPLIPVCARLYSIPRDDAPNGVLGYTSLFNDPPERMVVPLVGDIHAAGRPLTPAELSRCGVVQLTDELQQPLEVLGFMMGHRSLFVPSLLFFGVDPASLPTNLPLGWKFKGTGVRRYFAHKIGKCAATMAPIISHPEDTVILGADTDYYSRGFFAQRRRYAGRSGIFADVAHQQPAQIPMGGDIDYRPGLHVQKRLTACGGSLGCHFDGAARLLEKGVLDSVLEADSGMVAAAFYVVREIWPAASGSTLRLDHITRPIRAQLEGAPLRSVLVASTNMGALIEAERGSREKSVARQKLLEISRQAGRNVSAALQAGMSLYFDRNSDDNLLTTGLPLDFGDYHPNTGWHQLGTLVFRYLVDLHRLARASLVTTTQFFDERYGSAFFREFLSADHAAQVSRLGRAFFSRDDDGAPIEVLDSREYLRPALRIAAEAIAAWALRQLSVIREGEPGPQSVRADLLTQFFTRQHDEWAALSDAGVSFAPLTADVLERELLGGRGVLVQATPYGIEGEQTAQSVLHLLLRVFAVRVALRHFLERDKPGRWNELPPLLGMKNAALQ